MTRSYPGREGSRSEQQDAPVTSGSLLTMMLSVGDGTRLVEKGNSELKSVGLYTLLARGKGVPTPTQPVGLARQYNQL